VDTEGADTLVLMGCDALLKRKMVREIWYEQNRPRMELLGVDPDEARRYLESVDYICRATSNPRHPLAQWVAVPR
jgi:hypothetical protein